MNVNMNVNMNINMLYNGVFMKYNKFFFGFVLALLFVSANLFASINPKIQLQDYSLSETPAQPGHIINLTLKLKSLESDNCAERVAVQLVVSYPLSIQGSDTQYIDSLCYRDVESVGTFSFLLLVDNLAFAGTYPISVITTYEKRFTKLSESNTINARVGGDPSFIASISSSNPVDIYPGDDAKISIVFQNTGSSMVQSAIASASSSGIIVKWSGANQIIGQISARSSANAIFSIEAPKDLSPGVYPLDVVLNYISEDRKNSSTNFHFEIPIKEKADFEAYYPLEDSLHSGATQEFTLSLSNTGTQKAKNIKVRIKPLFPFSTDGTVRYVNSLNPGESTELVYAITVDKDATEGSQLSSVLIEFEDPQGKSFSDSADFSINVRSSTFVESIEPFILYIAIALLFVLLFFSRVLLSKLKKK